MSADGALARSGPPPLGPHWSGAKVVVPRPLVALPVPVVPTPLGAAWSGSVALASVVPLAPAAPTEKAEFKIPAVALSAVDLLKAAISAQDRTERAEQVEMAAHVAEALIRREPVVVQAGTGTGKSIAYLVAAIDAVVNHGGRVVISTSTIALQNQIVKRDLPELLDALERAGELSYRPTFALLKGRKNYLCQYRLYRAKTEAERLDLLNRERWGARVMTGDRGDMTTAVSNEVWNRYSVSPRECLGAANCDYAEAGTCYSEAARARAAEVDIVVTNHALLAVDAATEVDVLPRHTSLVVDEAHDLEEKITETCTVEFSPASLDAAVEAVEKLPGVSSGDLALAADELLELLGRFSVAVRVDDLESGPKSSLDVSLEKLRTAAVEVLRDIEKFCGKAEPALRYAAVGAATWVNDAADRMIAAADTNNPARLDVAWIDREKKRYSVLKAAPLSVADTLRERLFGSGKNTVLTSATLMVGKSFEAMHRNWGLDGESPVKSVDVGTPFDYSSSGYLYLAGQLPIPMKNPPVSERPNDMRHRLDEMEALMEACGGRTLALFSSRWAMEIAVERMRARFGATRILCQDDNDIDVLRNQFAAEPETSLFGMDSLRQGFDVPGSSLSLVVIEKLPYSPPNPLQNARFEIVNDLRGWKAARRELSNDPTAVKLAQGVGRLKRSVTDVGVVAILDSRIVDPDTGEYLLSALPPYPRLYGSNPAEREKALSYLRDIRDGNAAQPR